MNYASKTMTVVEPRMGRSVALSGQAQQVVDVGRVRNWHFEVLGRAPMPAEPVLFAGEWMIVPAEQDTSSVPAAALDRVRAIIEAGVRPLGFLIVHEVEQQLAAPRRKHSRFLPMRTVSPELQSALKASGMALGTALLVAGGAALSVAALTLSAAVAVPALLLVGAVAALDPILVVVTEDEEWIEIFRWWD